MSNEMSTDKVKDQAVSESIGTANYQAVNRATPGIANRPVFARKDGTLTTNAIDPERDPAYASSIGEMSADIAGTLVDPITTFNTNPVDGCGWEKKTIERRNDALQVEKAKAQNGTFTHIPTSQWQAMCDKLASTSAELLEWQNKCITLETIRDQWIARSKEIETQRDKYSVEMNVAYKENYELREAKGELTGYNASQIEHVKSLNERIEALTSGSNKLQDANHIQSGWLAARDNRISELTQINVDQINCIEGQKKCIAEQAEQLQQRADEIKRHTEASARLAAERDKLQRELQISKRTSKALASSLYDAAPNGKTPVTVHYTFTSEGTRLISQERLRQIEVEHYTPPNDMRYSWPELRNAASCYITFARDDAAKGTDGALAIPKLWPFNAEFWKPAGYVRNLSKAGALIAAEIDRYLANEKNKSVLTDDAAKRA